MIVFRFDDDRKFPLVSSLTTVGRAVRTEVVADGMRRSLRIVTKGGRRLDGERELVLALPLHAVSGAMERIELEISGTPRSLPVYIEGGDGDGVGLVWMLSDQDGTTDRRVLAGLVAAPQDRWDKDGAGLEKAFAEPLTFHRLRFTVSDAAVVNIVLHELRLTGDVRTVPTGLSDT